MAQALYEKKEKACVLKLDKDLFKEAEEILSENVEFIVCQDKKQKEKKMSRAMRKLIEKSKNNVNYMKEIKNVKNIKAQMNFRMRNIY